MRLELALKALNTVAERRKEEEAARTKERRLHTLRCSDIDAGSVEARQTQDPFQERTFLAQVKQQNQRKNELFLTLEVVRLTHTSRECA